MADLSLNVAANTTSAQASMGQLATITEAQMKRIASFVKAATDEQAKMARTVKDAANSDSYQKIADGAHKVESAHAGVNRELLVLGHEISQGNFSRFGGSLLVLAERTNFLSFALTGTGAVVSVLGAALLGAVALIGMGAIEGDKFAKSLQLTGNYAAVTAAQIKLMSDAQSKQTGQTGGGARSSLEAVAGSGLFGPEEVAVAARAMGDLHERRVMNFNLKTAIGSIAPTLATMLGGPLAGTAVAALEGALGLTSGTGADGVTAAVAAGMTPEAIANVRAADQKHLEVMQQQGIDLDKLNDDFAMSMASTDTADRASARGMQVSTKSYTAPALAWLVVIGFVLVTTLKMIGKLPPTDQTTGDLLTTLRDATLIVLTFYFGSSHGSLKKDETIQAQAKAAAGSAP